MGIAGRNVALVFAGYVAAVVAAVLTVTLAIAVLAGSVSLDDFTAILIPGLAITFSTALPGFLVAVWASRRYAWRHWHQYALAGAANAVPALLVYHGDTMLTAIYAPLSFCAPGGFVGGLAYWVVTRRLVRWDAPPSPAVASPQ